MVTEGCPAVLRANERTPGARARLAGWSEADEPEGRQTLSIAGHRGMGLSCPELSADTRKIMRRWSGDASGISTRRLRPQRDHKRKRPPQGWPKSLHKWWLRTESNRRHGDFQGCTITPQTLCPNGLLIINTFLHVAKNSHLDPVRCGLLAQKWRKSLDPRRVVCKVLRRQVGVPKDRLVRPPSPKLHKGAE